MEIANEKDVELIATACESFPYFIEHIFFDGFEDYKCPQHLKDWAKEMQENPYTIKMSARRHLKSTLIYAYIMWKVYINVDKDIELLYISYNDDLARYHTSNIKRLISKNKYFEEIEDNTTAESVLRLKWKGEKGVTSIEPTGINSVQRGRHPKICICDDVLADPTNLLDPKIITKINKLFFEAIMSLPKIDGGELHLVGTPQTNNDLFFLTKGNPTFHWSSCPAIINYINKEVLWPDIFSYDKLINIRDKEIGEKAFSKEYMCVPVHTVDAFFKREHILDVVDINIIPRNFLTDKQGLVYAGFDIGKHAHPSHISIFMNINNKLNMIYHRFLDNMDYNEQIKFINALIEDIGIDELYFDNTRGEFESSLEQGALNRLCKPIRFDRKIKNSMAVEFEKRVKNKSITLINDERLLNSILMVSNSLDSEASAVGHGDAFFSISLACLAAAENQGYGNPVIMGFNIN